MIFDKFDRVVEEEITCEVDNLPYYKKKKKIIRGLCYGFLDEKFKQIRWRGDANN